MAELLNAWGAVSVRFAADMFWQSSLLIGILWIVDRAIRRVAATSLRHALWFLVLIKLALPPSLSLPTSPAWWIRTPRSEIFQNSFHAKGNTQSRPSAAMPAAGPAPVQNSPDPIPATIRLSPVGWILLIWLSGVVFLSVWLARRAIWARRLVTDSARPGSEIDQLVEELARQLGLRRAPQIKLSRHNHSPACCGWIRPIIILPASLAYSLPPNRLRAVLLHELLHLRRGDLWIGHFQCLLQILYWYNPLLWLANAALREAREQAVDDQVAHELKRAGNNVEEYPETLLLVARHCLRSPNSLAGTMGILQGGNVLKSRIRRLLDPRPRRNPPRWQTITMTAIVGVALLPMACDKRAGGLDGAVITSDGGRSGIAGAIVAVLDPPAALHDKPALSRLMWSAEKDCLFEPRVVAVQVGQTVLLHNESGQANHLVARPALDSPPNTTPNLDARFDPDEDIVWSIDRPYDGCKLFGFPHGGDLGTLYAFDHPFYAVTDSNGHFRLPEGLPDGEYNMEVIVPSMNARRRQISRIAIHHNRAKTLAAIRGQSPDSGLTILYNPAATVSTDTVLPANGHGFFTNHWETSLTVGYGSRSPRVGIPYGNGDGRIADVPSLTNNAAPILGFRTIMVGPPPSDKPHKSKRRTTPPEAGIEPGPEPEPIPK